MEIEWLRVPGERQPWYCYNLDGVYEFNRGANPTAKLFGDRQPEGRVAEDIDGKCMVAKIASTGEEVKFDYLNYGPKPAARAFAMRWVEYVLNKPVQNSLF